MTPSTTPGVTRTALMATTVAAAGLALALAGCTAGGQGASTTTSASPTTTGGGGGSGECSTGIYEVETIDGTQSVDLEGQQLVFSGKVTGLQLTLEDTAWELEGDDAKAAVTVAGVAQVDATIDGTAGGSVESNGDQYKFALERSSGSATVSLGEIGSQRLDMGEVATAFAPVGQVTLDCTPDGATLKSDVVTLELRRTDNDSGTSSAPGSTTGATSGSSTGTTSATETTTSR